MTGPSPSVVAGVADPSTDPVTQLRATATDWWRDWPTEGYDLAWWVLLAVVAGLLVGAVAVVLLDRHVASHNRSRKADVVPLRRCRWRPRAQTFRRLVGAFAAATALAGVVLLLRGLVGEGGDAAMLAAVATLGALAVIAVGHVPARVAIGTFTADEALAGGQGPRALADAVVAEFMDLTTGPAHGVDVVGTSDVVGGPFDGLKALPKVAPWVIGLQAVLRWLVPSRRLTLEGTLLPPRTLVERAYPSVAVTLRRGARVVAAATLSGDCFATTTQEPPQPDEPGAPWRDLATGVAAWLLVEVSRRYGDPPPGLYGALDWQSVALQAAAARRAAADEPAAALQLLDRVRDGEGGNLAAAFSHVSVRARRLDSDRHPLPAWQQVLTELRSLRAERIERNGGIEPADPLQWRLQYAIAVALLNKVAVECLNGTAAARRVAIMSEGRDCWEGLVALAAGRPDQGSPNEALWHEIAGLAHPLAMLYRDVLQPLPGSWPELVALAEPGRSWGEVPRMMAPRQAFNWACALLWPDLVWRDENGRAPETLREDLVQRCLRVVATSPDLARRVLQDPFLHHWRHDPLTAPELFQLLDITAEQAEVDSVRMLPACTPVASVLEDAGWGTLGALSGADPDDVRHTLASAKVPWAAIDAVVDCRLMLYVGLRPLDITLLSLGRITSLELGSLPIPDLLARLAGPVAVLGVDPVTASQALTWQQRVQPVAVSTRAALATAWADRLNGGPGHRRSLSEERAGTR